MDSSGVNSVDSSTAPKSQPKALRFVTNYGAPHPKRRRIGAACLTCRKRKTACSGERPFCETCKQNKLDCAGYSSESNALQGHNRASSSISGVRKVGNWMEAPTQNAHTPPRSLKHEQEDMTRTNRPSSQEDGRRLIDNDHIDAKATAVDREHVDNLQASLFSGPRNRMPYFRWLGPTAIMPGFKQMVVKVKRSETDVARSSNDGAMLSPSLNNLNSSNHTSSVYGGTPAAMDADARTPLNLPFYDTSPMPPSELITHLANTFFTHLGCNYPFLQRERFLRDLQEKQVDAILVDAVCALAARFSTHPLLKQQPNDENKLTPAEYGHAFAVRAKAAIIDTFPCPSVAAVQAALLLAYNEFGESRDSGLWMYLGISIRMAQDLGMHKLEGLRYKGRAGPTPKMVKHESLQDRDAVPAAKAAQTTSISTSTERGEHHEDTGDEGGEKAVSEQKAVEQERVDTFWAVFFLDRVVSSGTGRRSTLRDKDIELSFPAMSEAETKSSWPAPFPALIRIIHLYGRVADLLNSIKEPSDITSDTPRRLATMESQVTQFYQGLSFRLHFDAVNFQHYMKAGEGTNFVLLHFWFHTLIVLLHQPTLLKMFEGRMLQLFPNSQQLSMSSAKTIADILSYSQLMDAKASLGNPFTTQPIYIAACAFLRETAEQTATSNAQSRASSPGPKDEHTADSLSSPTATPVTANRSVATGSPSGKTMPQSSTEQKTLSKHTLLATAASQHYQLCYKALQSLETYWAGTKYILTVLNQKFEGVGDPLLYTVEEGESAMERPRPEPAFTSPGWRRKFSWGAHGGALALQNPFFRPQALSQVPCSPGINPSRAIGWTLTGTMNSPSTNLAWHYPSGIVEQNHGHQGLPHIPSIGYNNNPSKDLGGRDAAPDGGFQGHGTHAGLESLSRVQPPHFPTSSAPSTSSTDPVTTSDAGLLLGPNAGYPIHGDNSSALHGDLAFSHRATPPIDGMYAVSEHHNVHIGPAPHSSSQCNMQDFGDMMIESQDVDMSILGLDMMPWFDSYPMHDEMQIFGPDDHTAGDAHPHVNHPPL